MINSKKNEKTVRHSTVQYSGRATHSHSGPFQLEGYVQFPRITLAGLWLEDCGFRIGDPLDVECGDGYLKIRLADVGMVCDNSVDYQAKAGKNGTGNNGSREAKKIKREAKRNE